MEQVFGNRYEVSAQVGSGGMATVYRGTDVVLGRNVAIKVLHPHLASRDDARARFNREAQAIARLKHPNIVDVYDYSGGADQQAYLVAEFVEGITLTAFCNAHGPFLPQTAALLGTVIAGALVHAHGEGIIHRDIKPDNLMLSNDGTIKLMDFGIATVVDADKMTATGAILGSPAHMAPEQIEGEPIDHRVDIFAFGTLLYFLVTGELPFMASNPHALFRLILEGTYEPPSRLCPAIGRRFEEIVTTCLARDPDERFSSMQAVQDALDSYLRAHEMGDVNNLLPRLVAAPEQFELEWKPVLVRVLCDQGRQESQGGSLALAIDAYNRALAIDPEARAPKQGLSDLTSRSRRKRRLRMVAMAAMVALVVPLVWFGLGDLDTGSWRPEWIGERTDEASAAAEDTPPVATAVAAELPHAPAARRLRSASDRREAAKASAAAAGAAAGGAASAPDAGGAEAAAKPDASGGEAAEARKPAVRTARRPRRSAARSKATGAVSDEPSRRGAGPKQVAPPEPKQGLVTVALGSLPPISKIFLDGELMSKHGFKRLPLVSGREYTLRCEPYDRACPDCPAFMERKFRVPERPPEGRLFSVKCDFRRHVSPRTIP